MRSFVVIASFLLTVPAVGCFSPQNVGPIGLRSTKMPLCDDQQLDLDAQVMGRLNEEQSKQAALSSQSDSATNQGVADRIISHIATDSDPSTAQTLEQRQLEQTERIIGLIEKIDDHEVRRILAQRIPTTNPQRNANATNAGEGVQLASYAKPLFCADEESGTTEAADGSSFDQAPVHRPNFNQSPTNDIQPCRLDESGLPIQTQLASNGSATASATVANIKPKAADSGPNSNASAETDEPFRPGNWKEELHSAIGALEESLYQHDLENDDQATLQIYLRLLHLIANDKEQATRSIPELDDECDQQFWQSQMAALATLLDSGPANSASATFQNSQRATTNRTLEHLRQAISQLSQDANLQIENVALCREVSGYGQFETFKANEFLPKQQVLIYCELENFVSVALSSGKETKFETEFKGSFTILNEQQQAVYQHEYSAVRDIGQRRRRDFYMYFPMTIPQLPSGSYSLQLEIEDLKGNKAGTLEKPVPFVIR